jgi:hypothetical protein
MKVIDALSQSSKKLIYKKEARSDLLFDKCNHYLGKILNI